MLFVHEQDFPPIASPSPFLDEVASGTFVLDTSSSFGSSSSIRIAGAVSIPASELPSRSFELPPPYSRLCLLADSFSSAAHLTPRLQRGSIGPGLDVVCVAVASDPELVHLARVRNLLEHIDHSSPTHACHLWQPSDAARYLLPELIRKCSATHLIDVGCGVGRDSVFSALHYGIKATGFDSRLVMLERTQFLSRVHSLGDRVNVVHADIRSDEGIRAVARTSQKERSVVLLNRFLSRPLLRTLGTLCSFSGAVLISTFLRGTERVGKPHKVEDIVEYGELEDLFPSERWYHVCNQKDHLPDGRPIATFAAMSEIVNTK